MLVTNKLLVTFIMYYIYNVLFYNVMYYVDYLDNHKWHLNQKIPSHRISSSVVTFLQYSGSI